MFEINTPIVAEKCPCLWHKRFAPLLLLFSVAIYLKAAGTDEPSLNVIPNAVNRPEVELTKEGNAFNVQVEGTEGERYHVEYAEMIPSDNWETVSEFVIKGGSPVDVPLSIDSDTGFFRVRWDPGTPSEQKIQRYGHGFSVPGDFTEEEYDYIANNYSIFTVEKRHAYADYGAQPNSEAATIGTAKKLKAINPDIKVLLYWNLILNWNFYESQTEFNSHPEWSLRDWVFASTGNTVPMYDLNNPEVQEWWVDAIADPVLRGDLDGVFLDAAPKVPEDMYESLFKIMDLLRAKIGDDKIVIYNGYRVPNETTLQGGKEFIDHASGVFIEFFLHSPLDTKEEAAFLFDNLIEAEKAGKMIVPRGTPTSVLPNTEKPFLFTFASYLLFSGPNSYYIYNSGYNKTQGMFDDYPEYDLVTGKALGSAIRDGWIYTREFERLSVTVNLETKEATIEEHAFVPSG